MNHGFSPISLNRKAKLTYSLPLKKLCVSQWLTEKVGGINIGNGVNLKKFKVATEPKVYDVMVIKRQSYWKGDYDPVIDVLSNDGLKVFVVNEKLSEEELIKTYSASRLFLFLSKRGSAISSGAMVCGFSCHHAMPNMQPTCRTRRTKQPIRKEDVLATFCNS
jgi:hypothetical protein